MGGERSRRFACALIACAATAAALVLASNALAAFPGANGSIAFSHPTGPLIDWDIYSIDPASGSLLRLTSSPENDESPSYSADGERIAFQRRPNGGASSIWVMNSDGTQQTQVTEGSSSPNGDYGPGFSPDGRRIVFTRVANGTNQVWTMNADGSDQTQLTFGDLASGASFSPDGQRIAFARLGGSVGFFHVMVMNADGGDQTSLTAATFNSMDGAPDFSPDGRTIVFARQESSGTHLYVMNSDGSGQTPLATTPDFAGTAFSPDGLRVASAYQDFDAPEGGLATVDALGVDRNFTPLTRNGRAGWPLDYGPDWQPLNPPSCDLTAKENASSIKRVSVSATCVNENALLSLEGLGQAAQPHRRAHSAKAKTFALRPVTAQVPAGTATPTTIALKVSKKGRRALRKATEAGKKGKATITATFTDDLGQASTDSLRVKFKPRRR